MTAAQETQAAMRGRSVRFYDDAWDAIEARGRGMVASAFIRDMAEAGLGYARCYRCSELVPVEFGNLTGKPLAHWVEVAGKTVTRQHRDGHRPVVIGADPPVPAPAAAADDAPATPTLTFLPPAPHAVPVVTHPVPEAPARAKKGRR